MPLSIKVNLRVTGHCNQGGRKYMEDMFSVAYQQTSDDKDLEYAFFGIFDGHGGGEAASFAKEHLMDIIVKQKNFWSDKDEDVLRAIKDGYINTHYAMWGELDKWPRTASGLPSTAGTTASIAFIRKGKIYIGHVGDSGITLGYEEKGSTQWKAKSLTQDHKPELTSELIRIKESGGKVVKKSGVPRVVWNRPRIGHKGPVRRSTHIDEIPFLAVARSLGDLWSYNSELDTFVVSPEPDVKVMTVDVKSHRCLIFGTDGLWNMMSPETAVEIVQAAEEHNEKHFIASQQAGNGNDVQMWINPSKSLVDKALERWVSTRLRADNTSVVTLMLDPPGPSRGEVLLSRKKEKILLSPKSLLPTSPLLSSPIIRSHPASAIITSTPSNKLNTTFVKSPSVPSILPDPNLLINNFQTGNHLSGRFDKYKRFENISPNNKLKENNNDKFKVINRINNINTCSNEYKNISNDDDCGDINKIKDNIISQDKNNQIKSTICTNKNNINNIGTHNSSENNSGEFIQVAEVSSSDLINRINNDSSNNNSYNDNNKVDKANEMEIFPISNIKSEKSITDNKTIGSVLSPIKNSLPPINTIVDVNCNNEGTRNIDEDDFDDDDDDDDGGRLMTLEECGRSLTGLQYLDTASYPIKRNKLTRSEFLQQFNNNTIDFNVDKNSQSDVLKITPIHQNNISTCPITPKVMSPTTTATSSSLINSFINNRLNGNTLVNNQSENEVLMKKRRHSLTLDSNDEDSCLKRRTRSEDRKCPTNENEPINNEKDEFIESQTPQQLQKQDSSRFMWPATCIINPKLQNNLSNSNAPNSPTKLTNGNSFQRRSLEKKICQVKTIRRPSINGGNRSIQLRKSFSIRKDWEVGKSNRRFTCSNAVKNKLNRSAPATTNDLMIESCSNDNQRWLRSDTIAATPIKTLRSRNIDITGHTIPSKIAHQYGIVKQSRITLPNNKLNKVKSRTLDTRSRFKRLSK